MLGCPLGTASVTRSWRLNVNKRSNLCFPSKMATRRPHGFAAGPRVRASTALKGSRTSFRCCSCTGTVAFEGELGGTTVLFATRPSLKLIFTEPDLELLLYSKV